MPAKLTYEYVRDYIASFGYELLSEEYVGANEKLKIKCDNGHEYKASFCNFKSGSRCRACFDNKLRLTYNQVEEYISSFGYKLLSKEYINSHVKLKIECDKGHEYYSDFNHFKNGKRCPKCCGNQRLGYEDVSNYIKSFGYALVSKNYKNYSSKIKIKCNKGHIYEATFNNFKSGNRCPECGGNFNPKIISAFPEGVYKLDIPIYDTYSERLESYGHKCSRDTENELILNVECSYCGKIYRPSMKSVVRRIMSINGNLSGDSNLYCSEECKNKCPTYRKRKYRKGDEPYVENRFGAAIWRSMVLERDKYTCQKCGLVSADGTGLEAHHYQDAVACAPALSCDVNNGITLCEKCHIAAHQIEGCTIQDIKEAS